MPAAQRHFVRTDVTARLEAIVRASFHDDGKVSFAPMGGGWVRSMDASEFRSAFREVPDDEMRALRLRYSSGEFAVGDAEDRIRGYANGNLWNGFSTPVFTREAIEAAMRPGGVLSPEMTQVCFVFDDATGNLLEISDAEGDRLPEDVNPDDVLRAVTGASSREEVVALMSRKGLHVVVWKPQVITPEGESEPVTVYPVGDSWCWERCEEPESVMAAVEPRP